MRLPEAVDVVIVPVDASNLSRPDPFVDSTLAERVGGRIERVLLGSQAATTVRDSTAPLLVVPITDGS
jgi:hypothetical protein